MINQYARLCDAGCMKVSFKDVLTMLVGKKFDRLESTIRHYYSMMEAQDFFPKLADVDECRRQVRPVVCMPRVGR